MFTTEKLEANRKIMETFLENRPIDPQYKVPPHLSKDVFGYIYCIENRTTHKKYIGSTYSVWTGIQNAGPLAAIRKRASQYIYEYNNAMDKITNSKYNGYLRPIVQAMVDEGIGNFVIYPVAETTMDTHNQAEQYFINKYNTMNDGYNLINARSTVTLPGRTMTAHDKIVRSEPIVAINMNQKQIIFADSMKLFGDYLGTTKDMIKNAVRKGKPHKGWFGFYVDENKRSEVLINNVINDQDKRTQDRHSDKAKEFYKNLYNAIGMYIKDNANPEYFPDFQKLAPLEYKE